MPKTCRHWIEKYRSDYLQRGKKLETWEGDYWKILKRLPQDAPLTAAVLHELILTTVPNSKTRQRACFVVGALGRFARLKDQDGHPYDPSPYKGSYSPKSVKPRQIPSDQLLVEWRATLTNPGWRWFFGMAMAYGLRPHEVFRLDLDQLRTGDPVVQVGDNTKTGFRRVWAFHPEWFEQFQLARVELPQIDLTRSNKKIGESACRYFYETVKLPFHLYDIRHAWAIRTVEYGLEDALSAQQMGHSVEVHNRIYQRWIGAGVHQRAYDALLKRQNRPLPPLQNTQKTAGSES